MSSPSDRGVATRGAGAGPDLPSSRGKGRLHPHRKQRSFRARVRAVSDAIDDSIVGDVIGAVALFVLLWCGLMAAHVFGG